MYSAHMSNYVMYIRVDVSELMTSTLYMFIFGVFASFVFVCGKWNGRKFRNRFVKKTLFIADSVIYICTMKNVAILTGVTGCFNI